MVTEIWVLVYSHTLLIDTNNDIAHWVLSQLHSIWVSVTNFGYTYWKLFAQTKCNYVCQFTYDMMTHLATGVFCHMLLYTLKWKCHHLDEIFVISCTERCHFDNFITVRDENVVKMATIRFHCMCSRHWLLDTMGKFSDRIFWCIFLRKVFLFLLKFHWSLSSRFQLPKKSSPV